MSDKVYIGRSAIDLNSSPALEPISRVRIVVSEEAEYVSGNNSGRTIEIECPWGTQEMADDLLASLGGYSYQPIDVTTAFTANPLWELGDGVTVGGLYSQIVGMPSSFGLKFTADVNAPESEEINHEYPYTSRESRAIERKIAQTRASLRVDVDQIEAMVESLDGSVSALSVSVGEISTEVRGKIDGQQAQTLIDQTLQDITLSVSGTDGSTTFTLKQGGVTLDTTTFDLHVDAVNIEGTLTAESIRGSVFELLDDDDDTAAAFYLTGATSIDDRKIVIESGAIELSTTGGDIFLSTHIGSLMQVAGLQIHSDAYMVSSVGDFVPQSDNGYNLGLSYLKWKQVWATTGTIQTSDRNRKKDISYDLSDMDAFFDALRPVSYKFIDGESGRTHYGLIAQDVEQSLLGIGKTTQDFGGLCKDENKDGGVDYALRYDEFIGLCIDQIKKLKARVNALETAS